MSRAQMAFRLGYFPDFLQMWESLFEECWYWEPGGGIGDSILLCMEEYHQAVVMVASEIPPHVYTELRRLVGDHCQEWQTVVSAFEGVPVRFARVGGKRDSRR
jgi:hypothetical protein